VLRRLIDAEGPCRLRVQRAGSGFDYLMRAILRQQISGHAANAIEARIRARFGPRLRPSQVLGADDATLRGLGLSRQKIGYLRDLSRKALDGLPLGDLARRTDERVIEALTTVKGVGRWTAEMFLMFRLGRPDVLPVDDYGIRKAMQLAYRMRVLPKAERMRRIAEPWRPHRSVACWYLWRSLVAKPTAAAAAADCEE
jgi:3-methyladenine DNA glycosylase/8-oxoguanine DNA glycosylase